MLIFESIKPLKEYLLKVRSQGKSIGFVPTMGALHEGHGSLIKEAKGRHDIVICSIFVNPNQFNDKADFDRYPRDIQKDTFFLQQHSCNVLFAPSVEEMYPVADNRVFDFKGLDVRMEGAHRPGHFNGVALIVTKLFEIVAPDSAFFGQKDFQQLAIIKKVVEDHKIPVQIISCPTLRETDGLAMSSRNMLLSAEERKHASRISKTLFALKEQINKGETNTATLAEWAIRNINEDPLLHTEYLEITDSKTLQPIETVAPESKAVICTAVKLGKVRLIDNVLLGQ